MFFYNKAVKLGENPSLQDYSYPGPRPQTKEAAIVMLADSVEASSRTLVDPTPARIRTHIETIVKGIYSEGQLDESDLTFRDLNKLIEQFVRIITGQFHQRIAYPESPKAKEKAESKAESRAEAEDRAEARAAAEDVEELKPEWVMDEGGKGSSTAEAHPESKPRKPEGDAASEKKA